MRPATNEAKENGGRSRRPSVDFEDRPKRSGSIPPGQPEPPWRGEADMQRNPTAEQLKALLDDWTKVLGKEDPPGDPAGREIPEGEGRTGRWQDN